MKQKAYPAFGYTIVRCTAKAGQKPNDLQVVNGYMIVEAVNPDGSAVLKGQPTFWLMLEGVNTMHNITTGLDELRTPGWTNVVERIAPCEYDITVNEDSAHLCLSTATNPNGLPQLEKFYLAAGETTVLPVGTKLYLGTGPLEVGDTVIPGMRQVRVASEEKTVRAVADCHGWIFK